MNVSKRLCAMTTTLVLTAPVVALTTTPASGVTQVAERERGGAESAQVILDWERILMQAVYPRHRFPAVCRCSASPPSPCTKP